MASHFECEQSDHLLDDANSATKKLGFDRAEKGLYLFKPLLSNKAVVALGSDWPVAHINLLTAIKTAMKLTPPGRETPWIPSERLSLKDALIAHTISAVRAFFLDNHLGS